MLDCSQQVPWQLAAASHQLQAAINQHIEATNAVEAKVKPVSAQKHQAQTLTFCTACLLLQLIFIHMLPMRTYLRLLRGVRKGV